MLLGTSHEDNNSRSSNLTSIVAERKLGIHDESMVGGDDEYVAYVVLNDITVDIVSSF